VSEALMGSIKVVFKKWKKGTVQSDKNKINTTNETEYMKEMVMKNQNGGNLNQETIEST
jgi:hypothetical protein